MFTREKSAILLAAMFLGLSSPTHAAIDIPIDDFDVGPSESWVWFDTNITFNPDFTPALDEDGKLIPREWGPGGIGILEGALNLTTAGGVPPLDPPQTTPDPAFFDTLNSGLLGGTWGQSATDLTFSNGIVKALVRADEGSNVDLLLRAQPDFSAYVMSGITSFGEVHFSLTGAPGVGRYVPIPDLQFTANEDWWMEFGAIGNEITLKAWKASEPEPDDPQLTLVDDTLAFGALGLSASVSNNNIPAPTRTNSFHDEISFNHVLPASLLPLDCDASGRIDTADLDCSLAQTIDGTLGILQLMAGDLNADGNVAFDDFMVLADNFGSESTQYARGDIDRDGFVAFADFLILAQNYGGPNGDSTAAAAVPEPTSGMLLVIAFSIVGVVRGSNRGVGFQPAN